MADYSGWAQPAFDRLSWAHVQILVEVIRSCGIRRRSYLERQFTKDATHFQQTLAFLIELGFAEESGGLLSIEHSVSEVDVHGDLLSNVLHRLVQQPSRYREEVFWYLSSFSVEDGRVVRRPNPAWRSLESGVRNFLMEAGVVMYVPGVDRYFVSQNYISLYVAARNGGRRIPPATVARAIRAREEIGHAAEVAVVEYERERLGLQRRDRVEHVSIHNAAAGYDILSLTEAPEGDLPRYIEVKAVSAASYAFYWTENERSTAEALGGFYYLYLLPVDTLGGLLIGQLVVIRDPYVAVGEGEGWVVEAGVTLWRPRTLSVLGRQASGSDDG
jgi:hypothetical protein